jgi:sugar O-acyltransferase (sialic acid O-acetyltransferase NeuD family)
VIGTSADLERFKAIASHAVVGVGDNITRALLFKRLLDVGLIPFNVIHPSAIIAKRVQIGRGVVILAGAVVNTGSKIGDNVCINTAASVDHDNVLEESTHIYPGAHLAGGVKVKRYSYVGTGAAVNPYLTIGENVIIGSGAVVCEDIPDNVVAVGVPARVIKRREGSNT